MAALVLPANAAAVPRGLGPAEVVALSGDAAIFGDGAPSDRVIVTRAPLDGGRAATLLDVPRDRATYMRVAASRTRVAVQFEHESEDQVYAGPPAGPLRRVDVGDANDVAVVGDTVIVDGDFATEAIGPDGSRTPIAVEPGTGIYAGDFVASAEDDGGVPSFGHGRHLKLRNWRTGEPLASFDVGRETQALALRADGTIAFATVRGLYRLDRGGRPTRIGAPGVEDLAWAGKTLVIRRGGKVQRLFARSRGRGERAIGLRGTVVDDVVADAEHVLWRHNGCVVVARVGASAAGRYTGSHCPLGDAVLVPPFPARPARLLRIHVRCLVARGGVCRGSLRSLAFAPGVRLRVPAGAVRRVRVPLTAEGVNQLREGGYDGVSLRLRLAEGDSRTDFVPVG